MQGFFAIIGAQRCGTTWLYRTLDRHPQIQMARPVRPEPKFFISDEFQRGRDYYLEKYFGEERDFLLGEKSTSYIERPESWKRMQSFFPGAKAIVLLRNPVERALSNYRFSVLNGVETRSMEEVFIRNIPPPYNAKNRSFSVDPFAYLERGHYSKYLDNLTPVFDASNIGIFLFEKIIDNHKERAKIWKFLAVDKVNLESINCTVPVNKTELTQGVPDTVYKTLQEYYLPEVKKLQSWLDIEIWKR